MCVNASSKLDDVLIAVHLLQIYDVVRLGRRFTTQQTHSFKKKHISLLERVVVIE